MRLFGPLLAIFLVAADQLSKWYVLEHIFRPELGYGDSVPFIEWFKNAPERFGDISLTLAPFFNLTMVWNFGISFGLMSGGGMLLLAAITVIIVGFCVWMLRSRVLPEIAALAMIVGGAIGNVADRLRFGAVTDFLDFHWQGYHFPAFNVADAAISIGVVLLVLHGLFFDKNRA